MPTCLLVTQCLYPFIKSTGLKNSNYKFQWNDLEFKKYLMSYVLMYFTGWNSQDRNVGKEQVNSINGDSFTAVFLTLFDQFWSDFGILKRF